MQKIITSARATSTFGFFYFCFIDRLGTLVEISKQVISLRFLNNLKVGKHKSVAPELICFLRVFLLMSLIILIINTWHFSLDTEQCYDSTGCISFHNKQEAVFSKPSVCRYPNGISCCYFIFDRVSFERKDLVLSYWCICNWSSLFSKCHLLFFKHRKAVGRDSTEKYLY